MIIGYSRVSTSGQDHTLQIDALERAGCERIFVETASGAKADRPELNRALDFVRPGDVLVVHSLSRLARSLRQLIEITDDLNRREIVLRTLVENIDTSTEMGRLWTHFSGMMQMFEVEQLRLRTRLALKAAAERGRYGGRPRSLDEKKLKVARALMGDHSLTMADIAAQVGVAPSTLYRNIPGGRSGSM